MQKRVVPLNYFSNKHKFWNKNLLFSKQDLELKHVHVKADDTFNIILSYKENISRL